MKLSDATLIAPGDYTLMFKGTVGSKSDSFELIVSFVDICPDV